MKKFLLIASITLFIAVSALYLMNSTKMLVRPQSPSVAGQSVIRLLSNLHLKGTKSISSYTAPVEHSMLLDKTLLELTYNLHGLCLLPGVASEIAFEGINTHQKFAISLSEYGQNCKDGIQTIAISLFDFEGIQISTVDTLTITLWYPAEYSVDIINLSLSENSSVLGIESPRIKTDELLKYRNITPIYTSPFARENVSE